MPDVQSKSKAATRGHGTGELLCYLFLSVNRSIKDGRH